MKKYSRKKADLICSLIRKDSYTIAEICTTARISDRCFYYWQSTKEEFAIAVKKAKEDFNESRLVECEKSLVKLINGYDYEERKTVMISDKDGKPEIKEQSTTKKHVAPNLGAIIHFQTNRDPENWRNRQSTELTGKDGKDLFAKLTDEDLDKRIRDLEEKMAK